MIKNLKILIIGAQASGKGTQSAMLTERFKLESISTGNIFRAEIKNGTELGLKAQSYMEQGLLVPDEIPNQIIAKRLNKKSVGNGFVLEGYPRNLNQARFLEELVKLDYVFEIHISDIEAVKRISSRRTCSICQRVYNIVSNPPLKDNQCDFDGSELVIRTDEQEEAVKTRLKLYHQETEPILKYYHDKDILQVINGEQPIEQVFADIIKVIGD